MCHVHQAVSESSFFKCQQIQRHTSVSAFQIETASLPHKFLGEFQVRFIKEEEAMLFQFKRFCLDLTKLISE